MNFSVLLSVYWKESPEYFKVALESVINQTCSPAEIVIVKDGPLTEELEYVIRSFVESYPGVFKIVAMEHNQGLGIALQYGVEHCTYDLIARMDTDDIALPSRFEKQLNYFQKRPELCVVGSHIQEFDSDPSKIVTQKFVPLSNQEICKYAKQRNPFNHMTVMFRKQAVITAGNYKSFLWFEDYYLWVRMILKECKMENIDEHLVLVRAGSEMFKRRGGFKYSINEIKLQFEFYQLGFITLSELIRNSLNRCIVRLLPNKIREYIYIKFLRGR